MRGGMRVLSWAGVVVVSAGALVNAIVLAACGSTHTGTKVPTLSQIRAAMEAQRRIVLVYHLGQLRVPSGYVQPGHAQEFVQVRSAGYQAIFNNGKLGALDRGGFEYRQVPSGCWWPYRGALLNRTLLWGGYLTSATELGYRTRVAAGKLTFTARSGDQVTVDPRTDLMVSSSTPAFPSGGVPHQWTTWSYPSTVKELMVPRVCPHHKGEPAPI